MTAGATLIWNGADIPYLAILPTTPRSLGSARTAHRNTPALPSCAVGTVGAHPNRHRWSLTHLLQRPQPGPLAAAVLGCGLRRERDGSCDLGRHRRLLTPPAAAATRPAAAQHGSAGLGPGLGSVRWDRAAGVPLRPGPSSARGRKRRNLAAPGGSREEEVSGGGREGGTR